MRRFSRFFLFAKCNFLLITFSIILNLFSGIFKSVGAIYLERITDALNRDYFSKIVFYILIGGVLTFFSYIIRWLGAVVPRYLMEKFSYETRILLLEHLIKIPFIKYEGYSLGELQSLIQNDTIKAGQIFFTILSRILNNFFLFIFSIWIMLLTDLNVTLIVVIIVLGATVINQIILSKMKKYEKAAQQSLGNMTQTLESTFTGIETIKTFWAKEFILSTYLNKQQEYCKYKLISAQINAMRTIWYTFIENLCLYGSVAYLGYLGINGRMSIGEILMFIYLIKQIIMPIEVVFRWMSTIPMSLACWERILQKLDIDVNQLNSNQDKNIYSRIENVSINNLTFSYDNKPPIIRNLDLYLERGKIIGLSGSSGSGKTTLLKILSGLYSSTNAIYKVNGIKINSLKPYITYASLERSIFPISIYENITLGDENINSKEVKELLCKLGFEDWINNLPEELDTIVSNENLSGGQKQSISTARALLSHKPIIILDEPFSALDIQKEKLLSEFLKSEKEDKIMLTTSHRSDATNYIDVEVRLNNAQR